MTDYVSPYTGKRYVSPRLERKPSGTRELEWACQCRDPWTGKRLRKYARHKEPADCVTEEQLAIFVARNPGAPPRKHLALMWLEHSQDPEARRLSGRMVTPDEVVKLYMAIGEP